MPRTAPQAKKDAVRGYGGRVVECEPSTSSPKAADVGPAGALRSGSSAIEAAAAGLPIVMSAAAGNVHEVVEVPQTGFVIRDPSDPSEALRAVLEQLDALLAQSDTAAMALFDQHAAALRAALGAQGEQLGRAIGRFEFEAARDTLRTARLQLEEPEKRK